MYIAIQPQEAYEIIKGGNITIVDIRDFVLNSNIKMLKSALEEIDKMYIP